MHVLCPLVDTLIKTLEEIQPYLPAGKIEAQSGLGWTTPQKPGTLLKPLLWDLGFSGTLCCRMVVGMD